jgi:predicted 3-demethylubiquinone-9 3-methyltransferase (glyoxalase superfamily)
MLPLSACVSVMVKTPDQAKTDRLWDVHGPCGWLKDRYGLSWQVVSARVHDLMTDPDTARAGRAQAAVMQMGKIDIATVDAAARKAA